MQLNGRIARAGLMSMALLLTWQATEAGPLLDKLKARRAAQGQAESLEDGAEDGQQAKIPDGVKVLRNISYGSDEAERFDVYLPQQAKGAPVIFMVHGGGWRRGDKAMKSVVENKVARWVPKGFILVSTNYRMLPGTDPIGQAKDVAKAIAFAPGTAASWGGDRGKFILMGHSAGAHLVSLLTASPTLAPAAGVAPWLGTVSLDSAAVDVVKLMESRHFKLYDDAFGTDPTYWQAASPYQQLSKAGAPTMLVCSSRRKDSCPPSHAFETKAASLGMKASVLEQDRSHREINEDLGTPGSYTDAVENFMTGLDGTVARLLGH